MKRQDATTHGRRRPGNAAGAALVSASLALFLGAAAATPPAQAQSAPDRGLCKNRGDVVEMLGKEYAEKRITMGLAGDGNLIEVFSASDGETWTIVVTTPGGVSCLVAAGRGWIRTDARPEDPGA